MRPPGIFIKTKAREATWNIYQNKVTCGHLEYLSKQSHVWPPGISIKRNAREATLEYLSKQSHVWPTGIFIKTKSRVATWNIYQNKVTCGHLEYLSK